MKIIVLCLGFLLALPGELVATGPDPAQEETLASAPPTVTPAMDVDRGDDGLLHRVEALFERLQLPVRTASPADATNEAKPSCCSLGLFRPPPL